MNKAEKKAHQALLAKEKMAKAEQDDEEESVQESVQPPTSVHKSTIEIEWPTLDMFNDSGDNDIGSTANAFNDFQSAQRGMGFTAESQTSGLPSSTRPSNFQAQPVSPQASTFQTSSSAQQHGNESSGIAGTISWLISEGVSLPELASVLDLSNQQRSAQIQASFNQTKPQITLPARNANMGSFSPADFADDVISLFGKSGNVLPSEISFPTNAIDRSSFVATSSIHVKQEIRTSTRFLMYSTRSNRMIRT